MLLYMWMDVNRENNIDLKKTQKNKSRDKQKDKYNKYLQ